MIKHIGIINDCIKILLLVSQRESSFTFSNDETQNVTSTKQMEVYVTFDHNGNISQYFIGVYLVNKSASTSLSGSNIMRSLEKSVQNISVNRSKTRFVCKVTTNVSSGKRGG